MQIFHQAFVTEDAFEVCARTGQHLRARTESKHQIFGLETASGHFDCMRVNDGALGVEHVFQIELLFALVIHDRMRTDPALAEDVHHVFDGSDHACEVLEP